MNKTLALLILLFVITTGDGAGLDPHGSGDAGCGIDPNGGCAASTLGDSGPGMDPNG